jgi:hypothetical protein
MKNKSNAFKKLVFDILKKGSLSCVKSEILLIPFIQVFKFCRIQFWVFYLFFTFVTKPFVIVITRIVINAHAMEPILASLAVQPKKFQSSRDTYVDETIGFPFCDKHSRPQPFQLSHETSSCGLSKMKITLISLLPCIPQGDSSVFFWIVQSCRRIFTIF